MNSALIPSPVSRACPPARISSSSLPTNTKPSRTEGLVYAVPFPISASRHRGLHGSASPSGLCFFLCWWGDMDLSLWHCPAPTCVKQRGLGDKGWWTIAEWEQSFSLGRFWRRLGLGDLFCPLWTLTLLVPMHTRVCTLVCITKRKTHF